MDYGFAEKALTCPSYAPISKKCHNLIILRQLHGETLPFMADITYIDHITR